MERIESDLVLQLKSCFFDIIATQSGPNILKAASSEMAKAVRRIINAEELTLFCSNAWKQQFYHEITISEKEPSISSLSKVIPFEELESVSDLHNIHKQPFPLEGFSEYDYIVLLKHDESILGFLLITEKKRLEAQILEELSKECGNFLFKLEGLSKKIMEEKRYKLLFRVTEKFHSTMDMDEVLGEIIKTLQEVYPGFSYYLLLSQDNHSHSELPIKDLEYDSGNIAAMQAYLTGSIQLEDSVQERRSILYAPLKGKQGVYGVLQVVAPNTLVFPKNEVEFISLLADTAGTAVENAQLYQQSKRLISDLQLINETSHRLNSNLRLNETINYMCEQIIHSFGASEVGFFMVDGNESNPEVLSGSTMFFQTDESKPYIEYLMDKIRKENDSLFIGDLALPENGMERKKYRSVLAVPMIQSQTLKGLAVIIHGDPYFFSFDTFKLIQSLIHHSTLAFTNSILREELEKMIITDHLTKLHSRNYLDEKIQRSMLEDEQGTFILIDIDDFKAINDSFGHQIGDEVLIQVANVIKANIRGSDIGARWGGEELAIYLPRVTLHSGLAIAERLVEKVAENSSPHVTISCGVSYWNRDRVDSFKFLFKRADEALYFAKNSGKNKVISQGNPINIF